MFLQFVQYTKILYRLAAITVKVELVYGYIVVDLLGSDVL